MTERYAKLGRRTSPNRQHGEGDLEHAGQEREKEEGEQQGIA